MAFIKYNSIENAYQQKVVDAICTYGYSNLDWVVLEKAHGANLSFVIDQHTVQCAKRTALLGQKEFTTFYNAGEVFKRYSLAARKLWELVSNNADCIIIYGELIGGHYPGKDIPTKETKMVQRGVYYCPQNDFYAYDIRVVKDATSTYLDYDTCTALFTQVGFTYAKPLQRGKLDKLLEWSNIHKADQSTIPQYFGLPAVADNIREGHVLKPVFNEFMPNGNRVILKDKNEKYSERTRKPRQQTVAKNPAELQEAINDVLNYVTDTRLDNVLSKVGPDVTQRDIGKLMGLLTQDVLQDWEKDWERPPLPKELQKKLHKTVNSEACKLIRKRL